MPAVLKSRITAAYWWSNVIHNLSLLGETLRETGHACGHVWRFTVDHKGHSSIVGGGPESHRDADEWSDPVVVEVRANSLREALAVATTVPLSVWFKDLDEEENR
jgi:hypothetical protein